jgi:F-box protein 21
MTLPFELLSQIFQYISPEENLLSLQLVSRQFRIIANEPLLWRFYCRSTFRYWAPEHELDKKINEQEATKVGWRNLWLERKRNNSRLSGYLDAMIRSTTHRLDRIGAVCSYGFDAKDFLLEQCRTPDDAEDALARRYWAHTILDSIHRGMAVRVWFEHTMAQGQLDRCLSAFDMFVLRDQEYDMDWVCGHLDGMAKEFQKEHPAFDKWTTRQQALALVRWLRATKGFRGISGPEEDNYRNLRNCLIGHALSEADHATLPIISCAIFQQIAIRVGLRAELCSYPTHVYVSVQPRPKLDLDGQPLTKETTPETMYLNPYGSDEEVSEALLRQRLDDHGLLGSADAFLQPASVAQIVIRTAMNIKASFDMSQNRPDTHPSKRLRAGYPDLNRQAMLYGSLWAKIMLTPPTQPGWDHNLGVFLRSFALTYNEDLWIANRYLLPLYDRFLAGTDPPGLRRRLGWDNLYEVSTMLQNLDNRHETSNRRYTQNIQERVLYKIGQVFRHKRYGYIMIINGWTTGGSGPLPTPTTDIQGGDEDQEVGSDGTGPRRNRTFYSAFRSGVDRVKVAQDNIDIITDPTLIPEELTFLAGKFFKRFDTETCTFVSNIKDLYPDD